MLEHVIGPLLTFYFFTTTLVIFRGGSLADIGVALRSVVLLDAPGTRDFGPTIYWLFPALAAVHYVAYRRWVAGWWTRLPSWAFTAAYAVIVGLTLPFVAHDAQPFLYFQF